MSTLVDFAGFETAPIQRLDKSQPVVIYGAGNCGGAMHQQLRKHGYDVLFFIDCDKRGEINGLPCYSPDDEKVASARNRGANLVLGLWNSAVDIAALQHEYSAREWQRVVAYPEWIELFNECIEPYWLAPRKFYADDAVQEEIERAAELWADDVSLSLFNRAIQARVQGDLESLNRPVRESRLQQYFDPHIAGWPTPKRFIDCGAFDGDTARQLPDGIEALAAFEPDLKNFGMLSTTCREKFTTAEVLLWPCGVGKETTALFFHGESGAASQFNSEGKVTVPVVALDDAVQNFAPDFLKMDIEGAEYEALLGAKRMIEESRPALAICVYHRPEDLWRIPLLIRSWNYGYKLYLRPHGYNGFDWVLYARI